MFSFPYFYLYRNLSGKLLTVFCFWPTLLASAEDGYIFGSMFSDKDDDDEDDTPATNREVDIEKSFKEAIEEIGAQLAAE